MKDIIPRTMKEKIMKIDATHIAMNGDEKSISNKITECAKDNPIILDKRINSKEKTVKTIIKLYMYSFSFNCLPLS